MPPLRPARPRWRRIRSIRRSRPGPATSTPASPPPSAAMALRRSPAARRPGPSFLRMSPGPEGEAGMDEAARLYRTIVPVADIERAATFYSAVLGGPGRRVSPGRHYFGDLRGGILALYSPSDDGDARKYGVAWRAHPLQYVYF